MKKPITFEKVFVNNTGHVTVYRASETLTNKANGKPYLPRRETIKLYANKEKTKTKFWEVPNQFQYIAVSDANTHTERLAFPCWKLDSLPSGNPYIWLNDTIAGVNTFMIHGGDERAVKSHGVYLRMLATANGFQFKRQQQKDAA